jgi:hypothetical protein
MGFSKKIMFFISSSGIERCQLLFGVNLMPKPKIIIRKYEITSHTNADRKTHKTF